VKRWLTLVALLALGLPACRTAGPGAPPGFADPAELLRPWVGQVRILRHYGDQASVALGAGERKPGDCDVAVRVGSVAFARGAARLSLFTLGMPSVEGWRPQCSEPLPGLQLALEGFGAAPDPADLESRIEALLQTPEVYLASKGLSFQLPPGELTEPIASPGAEGPGAEVSLGRRVTAWPEQLLGLEVWYGDPSGRVKHLGQVDVDAVVGSDGRLHRIEPRTSLAQGQRQALLSGMALWRFSPAVTEAGPVAARVTLEPVLRIF
jgi:hypothetical protein